ncbi:MAG: hypothetical protein DRI34_06165 [Deltaproteobacteria bacterium]|nr:MAG: hypothetical protein DRI34_06165 [Deltaproteobacteria bacterium]
MASTKKSTGKKKAGGKTGTDTGKQEKEKGSPGQDPASGEVALLELAEMARLLRISPLQLRRMVQSGQVPGVKVEGRWLFNRDLVHQAMRRRSQGR